MTDKETTKEQGTKCHTCDPNNWCKEVKSTAKSIIIQIKKLIKEGNLRSVVVKNKDGRILFQTPLTVGLVGSIVAAQAFPILSAISMIFILFAHVKIIITKKDGSEVHLTT